MTMEYTATKKRRCPPLKAVTVSWASSSSSFALSSAVPASCSLKLATIHSVLRSCSAISLACQILLPTAQQSDQQGLGSTPAHLQGSNAEKQQQRDCDDVVQRQAAGVYDLVGLVQNQTKADLRMWELSRDCVQNCKIGNPCC